MELQCALYQIPESLTRRVVASGMTMCANDERGAYLDAFRPAESGPHPVARVATPNLDAAHDKQGLLEKMREVQLC